MNLLTYLKKPILLFCIGMVFILIAVLLKSMAVNDILKTSLFSLGLIIEGIAITLFIKNKVLVR
jgi:hypothetical protein